MTAGSLIDALESEHRLLDAWEEVYDAGTDDGPPGPDVQASADTAATRIAELSAQFRERTWEPSPVVHLPIPKADGGVRRLAIPSVADRVVERALLGLLEPMIDPLLSPWSFAYRKGLGVADAIRCLVDARDDGARTVVRCDVEDCFERIPRWRVLELLSKIVNDPPAVKLVGDLLARRVVGRNAPHLTQGRGLHQGSPLSPILANLYLDQFDRTIARAGWMSIRFGDDIAIPARDRADAERAIDAARATLDDLLLELNLGKTRVCSFDDGIPFLGQIVGSATGRGAEPTAKPLETTVFVTTQGSWLRSRGSRIVVQNGDQVLLRLHPNRIRQIVAIGRIGLTAAFLRRAAREGIDVVLLDDVAGIDCRIVPPAARDPRARIAQHRAADRDTDAQEVAIACVVGKIQNMRVGLLKRHPTGPEDTDVLLGMVFDDAAEQLAARRAEAEAAPNRAALMGTEGAATRAYFQTWVQALPPVWEFTGRKRRPPPDPVNAMLSFGYTLLTNEAVAACEAAHLDPDVGFLHQSRVGRPSLALDLVEEFRPVLVDSLVWGIIGRGMLTPDDFVYQPDTGSRMRDRAKRVLLTGYEQRMLTLVTAPTSQHRVSWRVALHGQARQLAEALRTGDRYRPILWK
jgi:CRISP-associated protein Cas1